MTSKLEAFRNRLRRALRSSLAANLFALYGAHFARYLFPLITIPYVVRKLGVEMWGKVAIVQAYSIYVVTIMEFGFNLSSTREVSKNRDSLDRLEQICAGVLGSKVCLGVLIIVASFFLHFYMINIHVPPLLFWSGFLSALFEGSNFRWFFQGLEQMKIVAFLNIGARIFTTIGIFLIIRSPSDGWKLFSIYLCANFLSLMVELFFINRKISFRLPSISQIFYSIRSSFHFFLVRIGAHFFGAATTLIIGFFLSPVLVGYYAGAEKISTMVRMLLSPAVDVLFPRSSFHSNRGNHSVIFRRILFPFLSIGFSLTLFLFVSSKFLVDIILGSEFIGSVSVLKILSLIPMIVSFNHCYGVLGIVPIGLDKSFSYTILFSGIFYCISLLLFFVFFDHVSIITIAWLSVISQAMIGVIFFSIFNLHRNSDTQKP